jgi:hypothetical protein
MKQGKIDDNHEHAMRDFHSHIEAMRLQSKQIKERERLRSEQSRH